jgi:hypothetical protein
MDPWDNLLIRRCKKNDVNLNNFYKIIGKRCDLPRDYTSKKDVISFLLRIVIKYDLVRNWSEFILVDVNPKKWYTEEEKSYIDNLLEQLISKITCAEKEKFPGYR